ncbi:MAG: hypothetical protein ACI4JB_04840 [Porcipelethomonas sp.]
MKNLTKAILGSLLCVSLAACGNDDGGTVREAENETTEAVTSVSTTAVTTTSKTTAETTAKTTAKTTKTTEKPKETEGAKETEEATEAYEEVQTEAPAPGGYFTASDVYAYYGGYALTVNQNITAFPAAQSVDSSPSCYYEGDDKIFHYGDMDVYTYPYGGSDYVLEITLLSGNVSTARGLTVGMTLDDAIAMYGTGTEGGGIYTWYSGSTYMYVTTSGGVITSIGLALSN